MHVKICPSFKVIFLFVMKKIVVLISGRGSNFVAIEETALREAWSRTIGAQIVAVISNRPEAKGLLLAKEYGIDAVAVDHKAFDSREAFEEKYWDVLFYRKPDGKYQLNLWEANRRIFLDAGIKEERISMPGICTCCNPLFLYSHRASHGKRGNLGAFITVR